MKARIAVVGAMLAVAAGAAVAVVAIAAPDQAPADAVLSAYPAPGVKTASSGTQISLRGLPAGQIGTVTVRGSRSGSHSGTLRAHSDGQGASFVPARGFRAGESVTVHVDHAVRDATDGTFRIQIAKRIARPKLSTQLLPGEDDAAGPTESYRSRPDLTPPKVTIATSRPGQADGLVFLSSKSKLDTKQSGEEIVDASGEPVWFSPEAGIGAATDFRTQTYQGKPVLTYWAGTSRQGIGEGQLVIRDESYKVIRRIRTANGLVPDLHEFTITPRDTALLISYPVVRADLHAVGGSRNGQVVDSVVQEIDIATGLVVFEWHSIGAIAMSESHTKPVSPRVPWDYAHANAVHETKDGNLLVSMRNTSSIAKVDKTTGAVLWRLGGSKSDYKLGRGAHFDWQHDPVVETDGSLTIFDNSAFPPVRNASRAITLQLDDAAKTATLARALVHPRKLLAATQGSVQILPNGNTFVGWGSRRYFTEYAPNGSVVWDAHLSVGFETYRAYRAPWVGRPTTAPKAVGVRSGSATKVYASWNGATEVARWQVLAGASPTTLAAAGASDRTGFETTVEVAGTQAYVAVQALSASGAVLGTSKAVRVSRR